MATYILNRPQELVMTMKFHSYNAAVQFASKSGLLKPSKPYKRLVWQDGEQMPVWCVTLAHTIASNNKPTFQKAA